MHRFTRIMATSCVLLMAGAVAASAQDAANVEPATVPVISSPELVDAGRYFGIDLALDGDGHRHIVTSGRPSADEMLEDNRNVTSDLWYATDRDGAWSMQELLTGEGSGLGWNGASIAVDDEDGSVHIAVVNDHVGSTPGATEGIFYLTDKDREPGDFGSPVRVARPNMTSPSLAVADGVRYLAYEAVGRLGDPPPPAPAFVKTDHSGSWVRHRLADYGSGPVLGVDASGRAHIVYQAATADGLGAALRYARLDPETGEPTKSRRIPGTEDVWLSSVLALDPAGQPHIAWETEKDIAWSRRTADGWSRPETLGVRRSDWLSLVVDQLGQPHVVFRGRGGGDVGGGVIHAQRGAGTWPQSLILEDVGWSPLTSAMLGGDIMVAGTLSEWASDEGPAGLWSYGPVPAMDQLAVEAHTALEDLRTGVAVNGCAAFTEHGDNDPFSYGALAAMQCDAPVNGVRQLALFRFPDADSMGEYWAWRVDRVEPALKSRDGACADGRRGRTRWEHGELFCYAAKPSQEAKLRWTDERTDTYGVIDASGRDIRKLYRAWTALAAEDAEGETSAG